jgi:hypothetical protein
MTTKAVGPENELLRALEYIAQLEAPKEETGVLYRVLNKEPSLNKAKHVAQAAIDVYRDMLDDMGKELSEDITSYQTLSDVLGAG